MQNQFILLVADHDQATGETQRFYRELAYFFDDRHWPVRIWPQRLRSVGRHFSTVIQNGKWAWRLLWQPTATILVDHRVFRFVRWAIWLAGRFARHRFILCYRTESERGRSPKSLAEKTADRLHFPQTEYYCVDSLYSQIFFMEQGIDARKIRVLSSPRKFSLKYFENDAPTGLVFQAAQPAHLSYSENQAPHLS